MAFVIHLLANSAHQRPYWKMAATVQIKNASGFKWPLWHLVWVWQVSCFYHKVQDFSVICWSNMVVTCIVKWRMQHYLLKFSKLLLCVIWSIQKFHENLFIHSPVILLTDAGISEKIERNAVHKGLIATYPKFSGCSLCHDRLCVVRLS